MFENEQQDRMIARNAKRKRLGLPPLSADGMEVLGEYGDQPKHCPRCGADLTPDNIYIVGFCEPCVHAIIDEWYLRLEEPIEFTTEGARLEQERSEA